MKVAAIIDYSQDKEKIRETFPAHRVYLRQFLENGKLRAAGPFADDAGAMWILEVDEIQDADNIVKGDPFYEAGVIVGWKIQPFAYWSAQAARGST